MFTRAGFSLYGAKVWNLRAKVNVVGGRRVGWARVLQFGSGDLAWYSKRAEFLCWGLRANIHHLMRVSARIDGDWPQSDVETRRAFNLPDPPKPKRAPKAKAPAWAQPELFA